MTTRRSFGRFRSFGAVVLMALALLPAAPVVRAANTITVSFAYNGSEQTFVVPQGVTSLHVEAVGGRGGGYFFHIPPHDLFPGGAGGWVHADIAVQSGQTLYIAVGGNGSVPAGGFNGGGAGGGGGHFTESTGGGGASDIRTVSRANPNSLASRVVVAGGGGGRGNAYGGAAGQGCGGRGADTAQHSAIFSPSPTSGEGAGG